MPTNQQLADYIEKIHTEITGEIAVLRKENAEIRVEAKEMKDDIADFKARMAKLEPITGENNLLLKHISKQLNLVRLAFTGGGKWLANVGTGILIGGGVALIYHFVANWH